MKASLLYRIAAVLLVLFAVAHTLGFSQPPDPAWGADALVRSMRTLHFNAMGSSRSYWDFFLGAGFSVAVFFAFSAILAWQLGSLPPQTLAGMRVITWAFALCFAAITVVAWTYLFAAPIGFSAVVTICLAAAAWRSGAQARGWGLRARG
jgi:hypothetical protein